VLAGPGIVASPIASGTADAACASGTRVIGGAFVGSDGRAVSGMVGLAVLNAAGQPIGPDGCPQPITSYGTFIDSVNPDPNSPGCCFLLPTEGGTSASLERTWRVTVPNNAATVWVEAYPKSSTPADYGNQWQHQTDYRRYGGAMRRGVAATGTNIDVTLPLRCEAGGNTGNIQGTVTRGGQAAPLYSVVAFSRAPENAGQILGFVATPYLGGGSFMIPSLAPNQAYALEFRTTDGGLYWFENDYGYGIPVNPCLTASRSFDLLPNGRAISSGDISSGPTATYVGSTRAVFYRGGNGALWRRFDQAGQSAGSLGGQIVGQPDATSWSSGRSDVVARGADGQVWWRYDDAGSGSNWIALGGGTNYSPSIVSWAPGRLDVVITGLDGQLWHRWTPNYGANWSGWIPLGGRLSSGPDVTTWGPNRLDIVARGLEGAVWHLVWNNGWYPWEHLGGRIAGSPAASSATSNRVDIVAWAGSNQVYAMRWTGSGWTGWAPLGGGLTDAEPDITSGGGATTVVVRGLDGAIWRTTRSSPDGGFGAWGSLPS
jgi:hypothetical protein